MKPKLTPKPKLPLLTYAVDKAAVALIFLFSQFSGYAYPATEALFPSGLISTTSVHKPWALKGMKIYADEPLKFDFLLDEGDAALSEEELKKESRILIEYFLACLTLPEDELWVNLSPYEKDKIIPEETGLTEMGKGLLEQDYLLKKLTASLMYPETDLGKEFWQKVYQRAYQLFKTTKLPVNTFNKVWIIPDKAVVYEDGDRVVIGESHLKVMLESDYLAIKSSPSFDFAQDRQSTVHSPQTKTKLSQEDTKEINDFSSQIVKEVIIPAIEEEVNTGKNFATLRQMYSSFILATWFKKRLKQSLLGQSYVDQKKVSGIDTNDPSLKESIYQQYLSSYKDGIYNYIKSDYSTYERKNIKRRYYSGGIIAKFAGEDGFAIVPGVPSWVTNAWRSVKSKIVSVGLLLIGKSKPPSPTQELPPLSRLSEKETRIVFLQDETIEFESIIRKIISALYDLKTNWPNFYTILQADASEERKIHFSAAQVEEGINKQLMTSDEKIPSRVKKIILAIENIEEKPLLYPNFPTREEVVQTLLDKITEGGTLQEGVISYVLKRMEVKNFFRGDGDLKYLKEIWKYIGTKEQFMEYLKTNLENYQVGKLDDTFLGGARAGDKEWLIQTYFIPVKLLLEYSPYLNFPSSFSEENKRGSFFKEYIEAFLESASGYISGGDRALLHNKLGQFFHNEKLREDIADRADRLTLAMLKKETRVTREEILAVITSLSSVGTFRKEAQGAIVDYIYGMRSEENLDRIILGERNLDEFDQVGPLRNDINNDFPSLREAVLIVIKFGLPFGVIENLTRAISNQKESVEKNDQKFSLDENADFKTVLKKTELTIPQLRLLIKEGKEFMSANSPLEIGQLKAGVQKYLEGASFPVPAFNRKEAMQIILTNLSKEKDFSWAIEKLKVLLKDYDLIGLKANLVAINLGQKYDLSFATIGRFVTYLVRKTRNLQITQEGVDKLKEGLSGKKTDAEAIIQEGVELISASSSLTSTPGGIDFLDEKFFKLDTQGKGMDISYDPARLADFDISGLRIGEILIANPKKN